MFCEGWKIRIKWQQKNFRLGMTNDIVAAEMEKRLDRMSEGKVGPLISELLKNKLGETP